jgi:polar amino acid transport system substrate-binding protein
MPLRKLLNYLLIAIALPASATAIAQHLAPDAIRVVTENLAPYNMMENGRITGLSTEVVQDVLSRVGSSPRIELLPWARAYDLALHADNVLIYSIARTPEREHLFKWIGAIAPTSWFLFSLSERPIALKSLEDAKRYSIATVNKDVGEQYLLGHGFTIGHQLRSSRMYEQNYRKLKVDRVDLWISNELNAISLMRQHGDDPNTIIRSLALPELSSREGLYMAFSLGTSDAVVDQYRLALQSIRLDGTYNAVLKKWLGDQAASTLE